MRYVDTTYAAVHLRSHRWGRTRANGARNDAHHHRAVWLDHQAGHSPAVTPHEQIVDVHRGPPAASLLAIYLDRKSFTKFADEPENRLKLNSIRACPGRLPQFVPRFVVETSEGHAHRRNL